MFTFSKCSRGSYALSKISIRCHGSITKTNSRILKNLAVSRNPKALKAELLRVVKENSGIAPNINFPKLTAQLCVSKKNVEFDLAFEILGCLEEEKPNSMLLGLYELIDKCVDCDRTDDAMKVYSRLKNMNEKLDAPGTLRLLTALSSECRIPEIVDFLEDHQITDCDLTIISEPLIMSGNMKLFNKYLRRFMEQKNVSNQPESSERVARVIRSIMYARLRRYIQLGELTVEEKGAIKDTLMILQNYHELKIHPDVSETLSFFQAFQLHELEIMSERLTQTDLADYDIDMTYHEIRGTNRLPKFEPIHFPFVVEGDDDIRRDWMGSKTIKDLSTELKRRDPSRVLLYRNTLFPDAYEIEMRHLREKNMDKLLEKVFQFDTFSYSLIGAVSDDTEILSDDEDDSDSDEDGYDSQDTQFDEDFEDSNGEDSDDESEDGEQMMVTLIAEYAQLHEIGYSRAKTPRTLLPPSFHIHDITRTLEKRSPSVTLQYAEDLFDVPYEPSSWPRIFMPGGFILHKSEKKDATLQKSPASKE
jgi:hypothetical protein